MRSQPMLKPTSRVLAIAAIALIALGGTGYLALGQLQPRTGQVAETAVAPLRPSYLVNVREPTPAEMAQRRALADAKPAPRPIDLTPRASVDVALAAPDAAQTGPLARVLSDVNVRSGPGRESATLSVAGTGAEVKVIEQQGGWSRVSLPDGSDGWIASRYLQQ